MARRREAQLTRRERQIMDVIYQRGQASVAEVIEGLPDPPSYSSVRAMMNILEDKGDLTHKKEGVRYVYRPVRPRKRAGRSAFNRVLDTFFDGSLEKALAAHLANPKSELDEEQVQRLTKLIQEAREKGD